MRCKLVSAIPHRSVEIRTPNLKILGPGNSRIDYVSENEISVTFSIEMIPYSTFENQKDYIVHNTKFPGGIYAYGTDSTETSKWVPPFVSFFFLRSWHRVVSTWASNCLHLFP